MLHLDLTGTFVDGWGKPVDAAIEKNDSVGVDRNLVGSIGTKRRKKREKKQIIPLCSDRNLLWGRDVTDSLCL